MILLLTGDGGLGGGRWVCDGRDGTGVAVEALRGPNVSGDRDWRVVAPTDRALLGCRRGEEPKGYLSSGLINDMAETTIELRCSPQTNTTTKVANDATGDDGENLLVYLESYIARLNKDERRSVRVIT